MKKFVFCLLISILCFPCHAQSWKLTWSDEFDYTGLPDSSKWDYEVGYVRNDELQYYTEARLENARVESGMLIIETRKEPYQDFNYTSVSVHTLNTGNFLYGRFEVRAKLPTGRGMWPAIWLLGVNREEVGWPACGEIDIMENVGFLEDEVFGSVHTEAYNHTLLTQKISYLEIETPFKIFHVYALEWCADSICFFVDSIKYFTFLNEGLGWETWPFDKPFYLIINAAVGGSAGGIMGIDDSIFPQKYYIDYVRVYEDEKAHVLPWWNDLTVWPNPFTREINISLAGKRYKASGKGMQIKIYNTQGRIVSSLPSTSYPLPFTCTPQACQWEASGLPNGTYFIKLGSTNQKPVKAIKLK
jgi:beta-glucanase (GH16 family)